MERYTDRNRRDDSWREYDERGDRRLGNRHYDEQADLDRQHYSSGRYYYEGRTYPSDRTGGRVFTGERAYSSEERGPGYRSEGRGFGDRDYGARGYGSYERGSRGWPEERDHTRSYAAGTPQEAYREMGHGYADRDYGYRSAGRDDTGRGEPRRWDDAWNGYGYAPDEDRRFRGQGGMDYGPSGMPGGRSGYRDAYSSRESETLNDRDRDYGYSGYAGRTYSDRDLDRGYGSWGHDRRETGGREYDHARDDHSRQFPAPDYSNTRMDNLMGGDGRYGTQRSGHEDYNRNENRRNENRRNEGRPYASPDGGRPYEGILDPNRGPYQSGDRNWTRDEDRGRGYGATEEYGRSREAGRGRAYGQDSDDRDVTPSRNRRRVPEF